MTETERAACDLEDRERHRANKQKGRAVQTTEFPRHRVPGPIQLDSEGPLAYVMEVGAETVALDLS